MQTHTSRLQRAQLELFHPRSEATHWHKLPHEIQQRAVTLLVRLLREYSGSPYRPAAAKEEDSDE